ncbi:MAG: hypothetical protein IJ597_03170 [Synergistaceae bacterium]|nr:hypothetical protein [Synergistaceae bacterium]
MKAHQKQGLVFPTSSEAFGGKGLTLNGADKIRNRSYKFCGGLYELYFKPKLK